jgi:hypothetical protein
MNYVPKSENIDDIDDDHELYTTVMSIDKPRKAF